MAHLQRLMWFAVGVLLAAVPLLAFADTYPAQTWPATTYSVSCTRAPTQEEACQKQTTCVGYGASRIEGVRCRTYVGLDFTGASVSGSFTTSTWCPYGGTLSGSNCINAPACETGERMADGSCFTCPEGRTWNGTTCESPCEAKAGNSYGTANSWAVLDADRVPSGAPTFCAGQCQVTGGKVECQSVSAGGTTSDYVALGVSCAVQGPFTYTGHGCGPAGSMPQLVGVDDTQNPWWSLGDDMKACSAQGGYWGNVNGIDACVRPQPGETFDKETSTGNETTGTSETSADGTTTEKTTSTTTECKDGKCTTTTTTTTTTKGADGQQIGESTTETKAEVKSEADFCKANPQHAQCAGMNTGGEFAGNCAAGFTCSGDAVQCAIARLQHEQACQAMAVLEEGEGFMESLGAVEPTDAKVAEALNRDGEFDFDIAEVFQDAQQNYVTFTASCLPPMGFTFKGQTYSFNTGFICEIGDFVRLMLHLIAYMTVLRVIQRAFG